ncbi:MAG: ankyrin repeat domain-containing protein [Fimbriimonadaceae bacterium]
MPLAAENADVESIQRLVNAGANPNDLWRFESSYTGQSMSWAPLHCAASPDSRSSDEKAITTIEYLLTLGADINVRNDYRQTPLQRAVFEGSPKIVAALINLGAEVNTADARGDTPLHSVAGSDISRCDYHRVKLAEILIAAGADRDAKNKGNQTPLQLARIKRRKTLFPTLKPPKISLFRRLFGQ